MHGRDRGLRVIPLLVPRAAGIGAYGAINGRANKAQRRFAVEKVRRLRAMGSLCRQQAAYNSMNKWKLLADAEYWEYLAQLELSSYFQECNATSSNEIAPSQALTDANDTRSEISAEGAVTEMEIQTEAAFAL